MTHTGGVSTTNNCTSGLNKSHADHIFIQVGQSGQNGRKSHDKSVLEKERKMSVLDPWLENSSRNIRTILPQ